MKQNYLKKDFYSNDYEHAFKILNAFEMKKIGKISWFALKNWCFFC